MSSQLNWHIPFAHESLTLRAALDSAPPATTNEEVPLMLRLQRDPELSFLGQLIFKQGMNQHQHDCIHSLLGRGLLPMDQAFVLGFTIGCSKKGSVPEHRLHSEVGRHFYKQLPLFSETEAAVFKEGIKLAYMSFCAPLENFDFTPWYDQSLRQLRDAVGLESELVLAYYAVEKHRYPHATASQRLLPTPTRTAMI
jgi:hypothetical protein